MGLAQSPVHFPPDLGSCYVRLAKFEKIIHEQQKEIEHCQKLLLDQNYYIFSLKKLFTIPNCRLILKDLDRRINAHRSKTTSNYT